ncbi:MAG TPA: hypothetical protein VN366_04610 [Feifaniaceae bacterium]|nr:hypothetical protein [Feifaniaceae bacterium]
MQLTLGINTGFALNRYPQPEVWGRIVGELGVKSVQLTASLIDPFWEEQYIRDLVRRIREASLRYGFRVESIFTDAYTRVNHLLHPDAQARELWERWFERLFEIGAELGAAAGGSHFGILSFRDYLNEEKRKRMTELGISAWQRLAARAASLGYSFLFIEPMSIPREFANTVAETEYLLEGLNAGSALPFYACLDVGHAPHPDERDCYKWLLALGARSPIIHLQQTSLGTSNHWPFTEEYNQKGYIEGKRVLDCLEQAGCEKATLVLELSHREHWDTDFRVVEDHEASVKYWRQFVKE